VLALHPDSSPSWPASDVFLVSFEADGRHRWSKSFGTESDEQAFDLAVSPGGIVYVTGFYNLNLDFGGGGLSWGGGTDVFLASFDVDGGHRWSKGFGGLDGEQGDDLGVDGVGNVYLQGSFGSPTINLGGLDLSNAATSTRYAASFTVSGAHRWSKAFGEPAQAARPRDLAVDGQGNIVIVGSYDAAIDLGGGLLPRGGETDAFVLSLSATLTHRWSRGYAGPAADSASAVAVSPGGQLHVGGSFSETADFDGVVLTSAGASDIFVVRLSP
jgi:hypothetical protein